MVNNKIKTALISGASKGIGAATAQRMAKLGYQVAIGYKSSKNLAESLKNKIIADGGSAMIVHVAVEERKSIKLAIKEVLKRFNTIDILINNAGISQEKDFLNISDNDLLQMFSIHLMGSFIFCQEVLPHMLKNNWGRIINMSSIGGQLGGQNQVHYATAKSGILGLTKSLAKLYSKHGITANAISPGLVDTEMTHNEINSNKGKEKIQHIPVGRIAEMDEIIHAITFLAEDNSSYITGQCINVNGGMYLG